MQYTLVKRISLVLLLIMISALSSIRAQIYQVGDIYTFPDSSKGVICYVNPDNPVEGWAVALNDVGWVSKNNNKQKSFGLQRHIQYRHREDSRPQQWLQPRG